MSILTGDADVGFTALGGPCGAPGHTLTPEVLRPKQLLHLLPSDLYAGFSHYQACKDRQKGLKSRTTGKARRYREDKDRSMKYGKRKGGGVLVYINRENGGQVKQGTKTLDIIIMPSCYPHI